MKAFSIRRWKRGPTHRQIASLGRPLPCEAEGLEDRTLLSLAGNQLFPSDNPWNHPITDALVAANSATLVNSIGANSPLHPDFGTTYGGALNGIPYNVVSGSQPGVNVVIDAYADQSDIVPVPIPANAVIEGDPPAGVAAFSQIPSFVQVSMTNQSGYCWTPSTTDARALQDPTTPGNGFASAWYSSSNFTVDLDFTDGQAHRVAFYMVDFDNSARSQTVDVINPATSTVLNQQTVSNFSGGEYLVYDLTGNVELKFTNTNSSTNAVLSGIFFGAPGSPSIPASTSASASFVTANTATQGSWQGVYGGSGYDMAYPQAEGDQHLIVYNSTTNIGYELFNVTRPSESPDGQWHADQETVWNFNEDSSPPPGWTSADAAGLSILAGLVRPDETLTQGVINHALRFTVPQSDDSYVFPATHEAGIDNPDLPPMGERFRLNPDFDISGFPAEDQVILQALKTYGMIVADNGSPWFISGSPSDQWDDDTLHDLTAVIGSDFQAVNLTPVVSSLSQSSGDGGNTVTISGVNFQGVDSQLQVSFGGVAATNVQVLSDNTVTATVPVQAAGTTVDVTITTPYGTSVTSPADQYTYLQAPSIGAFSASPNPVTSGNTLTLSAAGVTDPNAGGSITGVSFYLESNGTTGLQTGAGGDSLLGTATTGTGGTWVLANVSTTGLAPGSYTFYAVATDNYSATSAVSSAAITVVTPPELTGVSGLLAQLKVVDSESKAFQRIDAGGLKAIAAALKAAKRTKTDAPAIRALDKGDAAKAKILAKRVAANDNVISSDVKKLVADGNALAKKPNARLSAAVASLTNALAASPANTLTPLTNDGATLQNTDDTNSSAIATASPSQTALDTAITSYQTSLASSLQTLESAITTALTTDVSNFLEVVAVLYRGD